MNFERFRVQKHIEMSLGCNDLDNWHSYRDKLEEYSISNAEDDVLKEKLTLDSEDLFYKGVISLSEALAELSKGQSSWPVVKLYYSVFYFLRASLACKGFSLVRNRSQYLLEIKTGEKPIKKSSTRYRNDHTSVINIYKDIVGENDILQTNTIAGQSVYDWLMKKRHQINYNQRGFLEPEHNDFLHEAINSITNDGFNELLDSYIKDDTPLYCFDLDHACIAAPLKRAFLTKNDLIQSGIEVFSEEKVQVIKNILLTGISSSSLVYDLVEVSKC